VSLTGSCKLISPFAERIADPSYFGFNKLNPHEIHGGDTIEEATKIFLKIISGHGTEAQNHVVIANSALAIQTYKNIAIEEAIMQAEESLLGLKALQSLDTLKQLL
jgi:anthranilate phosphoribosyltransferase